MPIITLFVGLTLWAVFAMLQTLCYAVAFAFHLTLWLLSPKRKAGRKRA